MNHFSPRYDDPEVLLEEAKEIFENAIIASDLMELHVPYPDSGNEFLVVEHEESV